MGRDEVRIDVPPFFTHSGRDEVRTMQEGMGWKVEMLDVFEHSWHVIALYPTRDEAIARARIEFAKRQPPPGQPDLTGGPHPPGIQDRIFIIPPDGAGEGWQYVGE